MELLGQRFGHIVVTGVIGQGGMGEVYSGFDETLERKVALKVVHADLRLDDEARERLLREARALSKLDHPNICRIYDYIESADSDLLVLEYIEGRTLLEAVDGKTSRADKLRIAISICEVLVTAHRAGILHRDLKPDNVMLTSGGEVKVLDFGLARWLNRPLPRVEQHHGAHARLPVAATPRTPSGRREFLATEAGIALGTPLYMSPEQARGESLTAASDMFAFGLFLQALFTGHDPHPPGMTAREVMLRVARGETAPLSGVPHDIGALIERLKMRAPADRPTAVEALERLRWLADRPGRFTRRGLAAALALIALTGGWRYTVDLQRERAAAVAAEKVAIAERAEAQRRRAQAEDLIDFMMGDLHQKLAPVARLDALDAAADRALAYMASLQPELMSASDLERNAVALQHVGEVRLAQGKLPEALRAFELAQRFAAKAVAKDPRAPRFRFTLGQEQFWVAEVHRQMGNAAASLAKMREYLATSEALARAHPSNPDYQIELAYGYSNVGSALEARGELAEALRHYERTLAIKQTRLRTNPSKREWQADLAVTINKIAYALQKQGQLGAARRRFEEEQAIYERLLFGQESQNVWKQRLVTNRAFLGPLLMDLGDVAAAERELSRARSLAAQLVAFDATNVAWRRDLAVATVGLAHAYRYRQRAGEALRLAAKSHELMTEALRDAPERTAWRRDLATIKVRYAETEYAAGNARAARRLATDALALVPGDTTEPMGLVLRADATILLGRIDADAARLAEARERWERAAAALRDSAATSRRVADRRARALFLLGRDAEAVAILDELRRAEYAHPDLTALAARRGQRRIGRERGEAREAALRTATTKGESLP